MADHVTHLSFELTCTSAEAERLIAAFAVTGAEADLPACLVPYFPPSSSDDPFSGLAALYDDADLFDIGAEIERVDGGVRIAADQAPELVVIAELIRILAPSSLPTGFTWSDRSVSRDDKSFGGGYAVITADDCDFTHVSALLTQALEACRG